MFCYQCEQTAKGTGCTAVGVCGKQPDTANLQDVIVYQLKGISFLAREARKLGVVDDTVNRYTIEALFTTVTNVNFDSERLGAYILTGEEVRSAIEKKYREAANAANITIDESTWPTAARFKPATDMSELLKQGESVGVLNDPGDDDVRSLRELLTYGLKGMAAYADHAYLLGKKDDGVFAFFHEALARLTDPSLAAPELIDLSLRCGTMNIEVMGLLDAAHTEHFGHPEPTPVSTGLRKGPAIIVSGHDLLDLEALLKQTGDKGISIYTHGEMLPAHGYPELKKYPHLAGHFGTAWQNQQKEFDSIPAAILFTTNCIQKPRDSYKDRVFTCGLVGWSDVQHIPSRDFSAVIQKALDLGGFEEQEGGTLLTGFARNAVLGVADKVVDAVKNGAIKHFYLVGGCDGAKPGRNYYTEFAEKVPKDCVILTLACGKFRFNDKNFGDIGGIPRLLDVGQCNDAYSAVKIAQALAGAFNCGVNDLPLSLILSWYEQKAVVILLSLLSLGIKGIRLGPSLPAFVSKGVLDVLVKEYDIKPISTVDEDIAATIGA